MHNQELTDAVKQIYNADYIIPTSSGTGALMAALFACHIAPGDHVIIPVNACAAVVNALKWLQITPIFCDVDLDMQIDIHNLGDLLTPDVKAIIIVHRFGSSVDMARIAAKLRLLNYKGAIIEDGAQAFGLRNTAVLKPQGISDVYISSFGAGKIIDADGGGILLTNNPEIYQYAYRFINHGADMIPFFADFGINFRMSKYLYPQITTKLTELDTSIAHRKATALRISDVLCKSGFQQIQNPSRCVYYRLVLAVPNNYSVQEIIHQAKNHNCIIRKAFPFLLTDYSHIQKCYPEQAAREFPRAEMQQDKFISFHVDERFCEDTICKCQ